MLAVHPGCEVDVQRGPDCLNVKVRKLRQDSAAAKELGDALWAMLEQHFTRRLLLDLEDIQRIDRALIEELSQLCQRIHELDGLLHVCGLSEANQRKVKAGCAQEDPVPCFTTPEEAARDCRAVRRAK